MNVSREFMVIGRSSIVGTFADVEQPDTGGAIFIVHYNPTDITIEAAD